MDQIIKLYNLEINPEWSFEELMNYLSMKLAGNEFDGVWEIRGTPNSMAMSGQVRIAGG